MTGSAADAMGDVDVPPELSVGDLVEVHGLQGSTHLNGRWGRVVSAAAEQGARYGVKLDGLEDPKSIRAASLRKVLPRAPRLGECPGMPAAFMNSAPGAVFKCLLQLLPARQLVYVSCCDRHLQAELLTADDAWQQALSEAFGGTMAAARSRCPGAASPHSAFACLSRLHRRLQDVEVVHGEICDAPSLGVDAVVVPTSPNLVPYGNAARKVFLEAGQELVGHLADVPKPLEVGTVHWTPGCGFGTAGLVHAVAPEPSTCDGDRHMHRLYAAALRKVIEQGHRSVALGAMPIGESGVQCELTTHIAVEEVRNACARLGAGEPLRVVLVAFNVEVRKAFKKALARMLSRVNEDLLEVLPVVVLDSMLPRQRLAFDPRTPPVGVPASCDRFAMIGMTRGPRGMTRIPAGVEVHVTSRSSSADPASVEVVAGRRFALPGVLQRMDNNPDAQGRFHFVVSVSWATDEEDDKASPDDMKKSAQLGPLVDKWLKLVRGGHERQPGQMDMILEHLGPMPPTAEITNRALWVCALINPLPALGVAWEVRPRALVADSGSERLQIATEGLRSSIVHLMSSDGAEDTPA